MAGHLFWACSRFCFEKLVPPGPASVSPRSADWLAASCTCAQPIPHSRVGGRVSIGKWPPAGSTAPHEAQGDKSQRLLKQKRAPPAQPPQPRAPRSRPRRRSGRASSRLLRDVRPRRRRPRSSRSTMRPRRRRRGRARPRSSRSTATPLPHRRHRRRRRAPRRAGPAARVPSHTCRPSRAPSSRARCAARRGRRRMTTSDCLCV